MEKSCCEYRFGQMVICGLFMLMAGCSTNYKLVSFATDSGNWENNNGNWANIVVPREHQGLEEDAAYEAAMSRSVVKNGDITAICLAADSSNQIVVAIENLSHDSNEMAPKKITYYLLVGGKIRAYSKPVMEPSLDIDYERTIYLAAQKAISSTGYAVVIYSRPGRNLTVKGARGEKCTFKVTVLDGFDTAGEILSEREVTICYDNTEQ